MIVVLKPHLVADEGDSCGEEPLGGKDVEGISEEGAWGLLKGESDEDVGDNVGGDSGNCAGEGGPISGAGEELGISVEAGGEAGLSGVAAGDVAGDTDVARVVISTFIPWLQCPGVPQMKYLLPGEERGMTVLPSLKDWSALVIWQES